MAIKQGKDAVRDLRNELGIMSIHNSGPSCIHEDNMSVVYNTSRSEMVLKKTDHSVCYHAVCESVAMGKSLVGHLPSSENITNLMTKVTCGQKRRYLVSNILFDVYDDH